MQCFVPTVVETGTVAEESTPISRTFKAVDVWMFGCIVFVFAALIEYAVLLKIRYSNANARVVKERMRMKCAEVTLYIRTFFESPMIKSLRSFQI